MWYVTGIDLEKRHLILQIVKFLSQRAHQALFVREMLVTRQILHIAGPRDS